MKKMNIIIDIIILQLSYLIIGGCGSPCPQIFRYEIDQQSQNYTGLIDIENTTQLLTPINVKVIMSLAGILPTRYSGRIKLKKTKIEAMSDLRNGKSIQYVIDFPIQDPLPKLTEIWVNEVKYCSGPRATSNVVTTLTYEHNLYAPLQRPSIVERPSLPSGQCGLANENMKNDSPLRKLDSFEQWPWLVAIFLVQIQMDYQCAGTLITEKHVLSAAHCFKLNEQYNVPANVIVVSLGRYRLRDWNESESINTEVLDYQIHPDYKHLVSADSDLAILVLKDKVNFNERIRPICLWSGDTNLDRVVDVNAWLVDWGKDNFGNRNVEEARVSRLTIQSQVNCFRQHQLLAQYSSNRTFCAGNNDGTDICHRDSGSGLAIFDPNTNRYSLRGIASTAIINNTPNCESSNYFIYVDIAKYLDWITLQISPSN